LKNWFFPILEAMKREELAKKLARKTGLSDTAARIEVDELVHNILDKLRKGQQVKVPGVGKLVGNKRPR
jgi:nucleoid DNA-binding protein